MRFVEAMESTTGRVSRIVLGLALVAIGIALGGGWWALAAVGFVAVAAGVFNFCLLAPFFGGHLRHVHHA